jgi:hypothetical protein
VHDTLVNEEHSPFHLEHPRKTSTADELLPCEHVSHFPATRALDAAGVVKNYMRAAFHAS